ncbi:MAG: Gfo/Idh/MocA family oxidoreductase [Bryobacteraceae bacterium]
MIKIGILGYGYWGPRIVRNFHNIEGCEVSVVCDKRHAALKRAAHDVPGVHVTSNPSEVLSSADIDAVAVITPVCTHFELAKAALENGKHVFVEKPFTATALEAEQLIELADRKKLQIMVDHTFLFTGAVRKMKQLIEQGDLGKLYYYDSMRVNLGLFQHDVNVIWDLAPHDLSIVDHLVSERPECVVATAQAHLSELEDLAHITVYFSNRVIANINVNWLSPVKVRTTLIGGEKRMLVWNDLEADEKLKIYDKSVQLGNGHKVEEMLVSYRTGDMWAPKLDPAEALAVESQYFIDCVSNNVTPFNDGRAGLRVVKILEAASQSMKDRGHPVEL